jgi:hypothetical protein
MHRKNKRETTTAKKREVRAEIGGEQRSRRLKERRLKERVGLALLLEHLDLQLHVHVTSIFGGGIPASILNHTAAVTELLPMPPSEGNCEGLSSEGD